MKRLTRKPMDSTNNKPLLCGRGNRRGLASNEYIIVLVMVMMLAITGAYTLGKSNKTEFDRLANTLAHVDSSGQVTLSADDAAKLAQTDELARSYSRMLGLAIASIFVATGFGLLYLRSRISRQSPVETAGDVCEIQQFQDQSKVLANMFRKRAAIKSYLREEWIRLFEGNMKVGSYMSTQIASVRPDMAISDVADLLERDGYRRVLVTDDQGHLLGIISQTDVAKKSGEVASDIMTTDPKTLTPDCDLSIAITILLRHRISCLPVVDGERLVGLITTSDLLMILQCTLVILSMPNMSDCKEERLTAIEQHLTAIVSDHSEATA